jgi:guanylate kinase
VQGAISVRRRIPQAVFVFLAPPSRDHLLRRLSARHTESQADLARRYADAEYEMAQMPRYDYCVVNADDDLAGAVHAVSCIVSAERLRIDRQPIEFSAG